MIVKGGQICIGNRRQSVLQCNGKESSRQTVHLSDTVTSQQDTICYIKNYECQISCFYVRADAKEQDLSNQTTWKMLYMVLQDAFLLMHLEGDLIPKLSVRGFV